MALEEPTTVDAATFERLIAEQLDALPERFTKHLEDVVIVSADEPTIEQREKLKLRCNESLFGLYEGVSLRGRAGRQSGLLPSVITVFRIPMLQRCRNIAQLNRLIKHTLWHEIAHHFGLDHDRIHALEGSI